MLQRDGLQRVSGNEFLTVRPLTAKAWRSSVLRRDYGAVRKEVSTSRSQMRSTGDIEDWDRVVDQVSVGCVAVFSFASSILAVAYACHLRNTASDYVTRSELQTDWLIIDWLSDSLNTQQTRASVQNDAVQYERTVSLQWVSQAAVCKQYSRKL